MAGHFQGGYYHITSHLNRFVLDVQGGHLRPCCPVILYHKSSPPNANQLWHYHPGTKTVRSRMDEQFCLDLHDGHLCVNQYQRGKGSQVFHLIDDYIVNTATDRVLDVAQANRNPGAKLLFDKPHGGPNQRWTFSR